MQLDHGRSSKLRGAMMLMAIAMGFGLVLTWGLSKPDALDRCLAAEEVEQVFEHCRHVIGNADAEPIERYVAYVQRAHAHARVNDTEEARSDARGALNLVEEWGSPEGRSLTFLAYVASGDFERASEIFAKSQHDLSKMAGVGEVLGFALLAAHDYRGAVSALERQAEAAEEQAALRYHVGIAQYLLGERDAAVAAFRQAETAGENEADRILAAEARLWGVLASAGEDGGDWRRLEPLARDADLPFWLRDVIRGFVDDDPQAIRLAPQRTLRGADAFSAHCASAFYKARLLAPSQPDLGEKLLRTVAAYSPAICVEAVAARHLLGQT